LLCWFHHVHLVMFFSMLNHIANACAFAICFNGHLPSQICHAQKSCRNAKLTGLMNTGWPGSDSGSSPSLVRVDFRMSLLVMVTHCLNILQMDKSHQQVTVHQSIRNHSDTKLIQTDTKPTFSNSFRSQLSHTSELAQHSQRLLFKP
jgi:hypothetical protein